jgi:hypothetical protein
VKSFCGDLFDVINTIFGSGEFSIYYTEYFVHCGVNIVSIIVGEFDDPLKELVIQEFVLVIHKRGFLFRLRRYNTDDHLTKSVLKTFRKLLVSLTTDLWISLFNMSGIDGYFPEM